MDVSNDQEILLRGLGMDLTTVIIPTTDGFASGLRLVKTDIKVNSEDMLQFLKAIIYSLALTHDPNPNPNPNFDRWKVTNELNSARCIVAGNHIRRDNDAISFTQALKQHKMYEFNNALMKYLAHVDLKDLAFTKFIVNILPHVTHARLMTAFGTESHQERRDMVPKEFRNTGPVKPNSLGFHMDFGLSTPLRFVLSWPLTKLQADQVIQTRNHNPHPNLNPKPNA